MTINVVGTRNDLIWHDCRSLPDLRDEYCKAAERHLSVLPQTSVIVCFHNEVFFFQNIFDDLIWNIFQAWSVLLRTVHSILNRWDIRDTKMNIISVPSGPLRTSWRRSCWWTTPPTCPTLGRSWRPTCRSTPRSEWRPLIGRGPSRHCTLIGWDHGVASPALLFHKEPAQVIQIPY